MIYLAILAILTLLACLALYIPAWLVARLVETALRRLFRLP